jgi:hypothetical protein
MMQPRMMIISALRLMGRTDEATALGRSMLAETFGAPTAAQPIAGAA